MTLHPDKLDEPTRWRNPRRVFVCSMGDLFHESVPDEFIADVWSRMRCAPTHTFMVLTKRPDRMKSWLERCRVDQEDYFTHNGHSSVAYGGDGIIVGIPDRWPLPNVWLGTSVEDQASADERIPHLLRCPAVVRFVSCEPLLGPIGLDRSWNALKEPEGARIPGRIDWVIAGGESGPGARPMHPDWVRSIRDQCACAGVPFFFKQWGEWAPDCLCDTAGAHRTMPRPTPGKVGGMFRCGKRRAGRLLDGREHNEWPEVRS